VRRHGDYALAGAAAMVDLAPDGSIGRARLCLFGVAAQPERMHAVELTLAGASPGAETFAAAAAEAIADLDPASDVHGSAAYRRHVAGVAVRRALTDASARAGGPA
jgi:carbon-monoxide dehydrogenase medium subunit